MDAAAEEETEAVLQNETPESVVGVFSAGIFFLQTYGWFLLLGLVGLLFLKNRFLQPKLEQWQERQEAASYKKMDAGKAQAQLEAMERARQRMQAELNQQAEEYKAKVQEKEEKARQEKIADWDRHQEGRGYRSKHRTREDETGPSTLPTKPKPKKPLRDPGYNPLMGNSSGACFRPPRRGASGGG